MRVITGKVNFLLQAYTFQDFLRDIDRNNCEVVNVTRTFTSYIEGIRGTNNNLEVARWYFNHCGTIL